MKSMFRKYVIIDSTPILFSNDLIHASVADAYLGKVKSAGFFLVAKNNLNMEVICFGESTSLKIKSRPQIDAAIILRFLKELN